MGEIKPILSFPQTILLTEKFVLAAQQLGVAEDFRAVEGLTGHLEISERREPAVLQARNND